MLDKRNARKLAGDACCVLTFVTAIEMGVVGGNWKQNATNPLLWLQKRIILVGNTPAHKCGEAVVRRQ